MLGRAVVNTRNLTKNRIYKLLDMVTQATEFGSKTFVHIGYVSQFTSYPLHYFEIINYPLFKILYD